MRIFSLLAIFALLAGTSAGFCQDSAKPTPVPTKNPAFNEVADKAIAAMKKRAEELKIHGAAVVAYFDGDTIKSWESKMAVVETHRVNPSQKDRGANLIAIAYSKACEMADTLKDSGSKVRPPMNGELGYQGGLIAKVKTGYVIAAYSGGPSEDDLKVSKAGLEILSAGL